MRQTLYANAEKKQRTKTREFLKSVMNAGQPYVEKNKYIAEMGKTTTTAKGMRLRKSGTEVAALEQNRRFSKKATAALINASAGEQDDE